MNTISVSEVDYITANRTIETISLKNSDRLFYVYNYEGTHFRLFTEILDLIQFFEFGNEPKQSFLNEEELEDFITNYHSTFRV